MLGLKLNQVSKRGHWWNESVALIGVCGDLIYSVICHYVAANVNLRGARQKWTHAKQRQAEIYRVYVLKFAPVGPIDSKSPLVQISDWVRKGDKPLPEQNVD